MFSGRPLQSAAAFLVYACQCVGRASGLNYFFVSAGFHFPGAGDVFRWISTIGGGALKILCSMSAGQEGELGEQLFCASVVRFFSG